MYAARLKVVPRSMPMTGAGIREIRSRGIGGSPTRSGWLLRGADIPVCRQTGMSAPPDHISGIAQEDFAEGQGESPRARDASPVELVRLAGRDGVRPLVAGLILEDDDAARFEQHGDLLLE